MGNDSRSVIFTIIKLALGMFIGGCFYKLVSCFASVRENKFFKIIAMGGIICIANTVIFNQDIVNISFAGIGFILIMIFCFKGRMVEKFSAIFVLYPILVSFYFIVFDIGLQFNRRIWQEKLMITITVIDLIRTAMIAAFWYLLYRLFEGKIKRAYQYLNGKMWLLIDLICAAPLIAIYMVLINTAEDKILVLYAVAAACLLTNIGIIFVIEYLADTMQTSVENQNLKLQQSYYETLEKNQLDIRKLRHDMNNQLSVVGSLLKQKEIEKAESYFDSLSDQFRVSNRIFCKNGIVNAVLNVKYNLAMDNQIDCFFNIAIDGLVPLEYVDLCSIFANTLDNAIESSVKIEESGNRKITVKARCENGYFSYCITNKKENTVKVVKDKYITDKAEVKFHGTLNITYTEHEFTLLILIQ